MTFGGGLIPTWAKQSHSLVARSHGSCSSRAVACLAVRNRATTEHGVQGNVRQIRAAPAHFNSRERGTYRLESALNVARIRKRRAAKWCATWAPLSCRPCRWRSPRRRRKRLRIRRACADQGSHGLGADRQVRGKVVGHGNIRPFLMPITGSKIRRTSTCIIPKAGAASFGSSRWACTPSCRRRRKSSR